MYKYKGFDFTKEGMQEKLLEEFSNPYGYNIDSTLRENLVDEENISKPNQN